MKLGRLLTPSGLSTTVTCSSRRGTAARCVATSAELAELTASLAESLEQG